jgi:hypothetical protein
VKVDGIWGRVQAEIDARQGRTGMSSLDLLELPKQQRALMKKLLKLKFISLRDAAAELQQTEADAAQTLDTLVEKTFLIEFERKGERHYKLLMARKAGKELPFNIWDQLTEKTGT